MYVREKAVFFPVGEIGYEYFMRDIMKQIVGPKTRNHMNH